uniref:Uncharacterized protein n=1 Tax=viral metagenome TaxID=1070528 RepID=A0A6H1ZEP6_9ZZZZ
MTRQEEIRDMVTSTIRDGVSQDLPIGFITEIVLENLHNAGCVLKVEGELPSAFDIKEDVISVVEYKKKLAGYCLTEPLIGDE